MPNHVISKFHDGVQDHHVVIIEFVNEIFDIEDCVIQYNCLMHR
ncbi:hypothetical protein [Pseudomonas putida]|nr:hypothetical protein [Pseudomonas putida]